MKKLLVVLFVLATVIPAIAETDYYQQAEDRLAQQDRDMIAQENFNRAYDQRQEIADRAYKQEKDRIFQENLYDNPEVRDSINDTIEIWSPAASEANPYILNPYDPYD